MDHKDRAFLKAWARAGTTLDGALHPDRFGLVGNERFSLRARRLAITLWHFGALRFSSERQERFYNRVGSGACDRRIAKCDRIIKALAGYSTPVRFEVWASDSGEASHWNPVRGGVYENQPAAVAHAQRVVGDGPGRAVVEQWNAATNSFIGTVWESKKGE